MKIKLTKRDQLKLLIAARSGEIETTDFPNLFTEERDPSLFERLLMETGCVEDEAEK